MIKNDYKHTKLNKSASIGISLQKNYLIFGHEYTLKLEMIYFYSKLVSQLSNAC